MNLSNHRGLFFVHWRRRSRQNVGDVDVFVVCLKTELFYCPGLVLKSVPDILRFSFLVRIVRAQVVCSCSGTSVSNAQISICVCACVQVCTHDGDVSQFRLLVACSPDAIQDDLFWLRVACSFDPFQVDVFRVLMACSPDTESP